MPPEFSFDHQRGDCWVTDGADGDEIKEGSVVRLRVVGITINADSMNAVGTMNDDYLGLIES